MVRIAGDPWEGFSFRVILVGRSDALEYSEEQPEQFVVINYSVRLLRTLVKSSYLTHSRCCGNVCPTLLNSLGNQRQTSSSEGGHMGVFKAVLEGLAAAILAVQQIIAAMPASKRND